MKKRFIIIGIIISGIIIGFIIYHQHQVKEYSRTFSCFDKTCEVIVYSTTSKEKELDDIVSLYKKEETKITEEVGSLNKRKGQVTISKNLLEIMKKINQMNLFVNNKALTDVWKQSLEKEQIPSISTLKQVSSYTNNFQIGEQTVTSKVYDINEDNYIWGYLSNKIDTYMKKNKISSYLIHLNNQITVGKHYKDEFHTAILHPITNEVIHIVKKNNVSVYTVGTDAVKVDGVGYVPVIDPETKFPYNYHQAVTVVSKDSILANMLSHKLYSMNLEQGKAFVKNYDVENVIWVEMDGKVEKFDKNR